MVCLLVRLGPKWVCHAVETDGSNQVVRQTETDGKVENVVVRSRQTNKVAAREEGNPLIHKCNDEVEDAAPHLCAAGAPMHESVVQLETLLHLLQCVEGSLALQVPGWAVRVRHLGARVLAVPVHEEAGGVVAFSELFDHLVRGRLLPWHAVKLLLHLGENLGARKRSGTKISHSLGKLFFGRYFCVPVDNVGIRVNGDSQVPGAPSVEDATGTGDQSHEEAAEYDRVHDDVVASVGCDNRRDRKNWQASHSGDSPRLEHEARELVDRQGSQHREVGRHREEVEQEDETSVEALDDANDDHSTDADHKAHCSSCDETSDDEHVHDRESHGVEVVAATVSDPCTDGTGEEKTEHETCCSHCLYFILHVHTQVQTTSSARKQQDIDESRDSEDTKEGDLVVPWKRRLVVRGIFIDQSGSVSSGHFGGLVIAVRRLVFHVISLLLVGQNSSNNVGGHVEISLALRAKREHLSETGGLIRVCVRERVAVQDL